MEHIYGTVQIYLKDIQKYSLIDKEKEKELAKRARKGDKEAVKELVNSNLRFVIYMAKKYQKAGIPLADLISAGNMGLIKAAKRYDERFEARFLSYAVWWIRREINSVVSEYLKSFRIPATRAREIFKVKKTRDNIKRKKGREPSIGEIAERVDSSTKKIKENIGLAKKDISLDELVDDSGDLEFIDIVSQDTENPMVKYEHENLEKEITEKLDKLEPRRKKIISYYFGLNSNNSYTLEEIGHLMSISRERVRQLRNKGLKELKEKLDQGDIIKFKVIKK